MSTPVLTNLPAEVAVILAFVSSRNEPTPVRRALAFAVIHTAKSWDCFRKAAVSHPGLALHESVTAESYSATLLEAAQLAAQVAKV